MSWSSGLSDREAVGGYGFYRDFLRDADHLLPTCVWDGERFREHGNNGRILWSYGLPDHRTRRVLGRSWTGLTVEERWPGGSLTQHLRTTLPGPLVQSGSKTLLLNWAAGSDRRRFTEVETGKIHSAELSITGGRSRLWIAEGESTAVLMVFSTAFHSLDFTASRHWQFHFKEKGARILLVPLLKEVSLTTLRQNRRIWLDLVQRPPLSCRESYRFHGQRLELKQSFTGASWSPLPPAWTLRSNPGLIRLPKARTLVPSLFGPYQVVSGSSWEGVMKVGWMKARHVCNHVDTSLRSALPEELAYAGDWTWDESTPLDQCLGLRTWAPLISGMEEKERAILLRRLRVPTPTAFRRSLLCFREPITGRNWWRDRSVWAERGDCAYDPDWYNGLGLSGLARAAECNDPRLSGPANRTVRACSREREQLTDYFEIYHDWMLGSAWSDPRGSLWLPDCCHNGMEGILAEARLCEREGRKKRADRLHYLAGKTSITLLGAMAWPKWMKGLRADIIVKNDATKTHFRRPAPDERLLGVIAFFPPGRVYPSTPASVNPYLFVGHSPEYNALLKAHGPLANLKRVVKIWEKEFPERYRDWIRFYVGKDMRRRFKKREQEARIQAPVFYHLAPEICFRLWVLEEEPASIARRYRTPLNRAEELLLRTESRLV